MIRGVHAMFYTSQPEAARAFFRDKLGLHNTDVGEGWLIFDIGEADLGFHPSETPNGVMQSGTPSVSFYCDDIEKSMADLKAKGVEFTTGVEDHGYGLVSFFRVPGEFSVQLYQPRYVKSPRPKPAPVQAPAAIESAPSKPAPKQAAKPVVKKPAPKPAAKKPAKRTAVKPVAKKAAKPAKAKGRRR